MTEPLIPRLDEVWNDIAAFATASPPSSGSLPTECPGWTVHDNVAHMIGTERMLRGRAARDPAPPRPRADAPHVRNDIGKANEHWIATYRGWDGPKLLDEFRARHRPPARRCCAR